jgi:hypothetical protein
LKQSVGATLTHITVMIKHPKGGVLRCLLLISPGRYSGLKDRDTAQLASRALGRRQRVNDARKSLFNRNLG